MGTGIKINPVINIIDEALNKDAADTYHLSIQLGLDGFSFCILDVKRNKYLSLASFTFQKVFNYQQLSTTVEELVKENELLKKKYKTISVSLVNNKSTLVPNPLFDQKKLAEYLKFNAEFDTSYNITSEQLKNSDTRNIFAVPKIIEKTIYRLFPRAKILHHSTSLIESLITNYKNTNQKILFVNVHLSTFEVVLLEGKHLIFYNSFHYESSEDFIYYLLFVCEQLKLNPENLKLILLGEVEKNAAIYAILYKYVRNIVFAERNDTFEYAYRFNEIPGHFYYNLLNQCLYI